MTDDEITARASDVLFQAKIKSDQSKYLDTNENFQILINEIAAAIKAGILEGERRAIAARIVGPSDEQIDLFCLPPSGTLTIIMDSRREAIKWYRDNLRLAEIKVEDILPSEDEVVGTHQRNAERCCIDCHRYACADTTTTILKHAYKIIRDHIKSKLAGGAG